MPRISGLELSQKIVEIDPNIRVCFMSAAEVNIDGLREVYPKVSFGCFIKTSDNRQVGQAIIGRIRLISSYIGKR
jgi:hypothetical protein